MNESVNEAVKPKSKASPLKKVAGIFAILGILKLAGFAAGHLAAAGAGATERQNARQNANVALLHAKAAARVVEAYFKTHSSFPVNLTAAEFGVPLPEPVQSIRINLKGELQVVLMGNGPSRSRSFRLEPKVDSGGTFSWSCQLEEMPPNILPDECVRSSDG